jgi:hypothetical protein
MGETLTNKAVSSQEQRRHARVPVGVTLDIRLFDGAEGECRGTISDVSEGGMTFKTEAVLEKGMTLHLKLPSELEIRGEVRHVGGPAGGVRRYGVRFHKIGFGPIH